MSNATSTNKTFDNVSELIQMYGDFLELSQMFYLASSSTIRTVKKDLRKYARENLSKEERETFNILEPVADHFLEKSFAVYKESLDETRAKHDQVVEYLEEVVLPFFEAEAGDSDE